MYADKVMQMVMNGWPAAYQNSRGGGLNLPEYGNKQKHITTFGHLFLSLRLTRKRGGVSFLCSCPLVFLVHVARVEVWFMHSLSC